MSGFYISINLVSGYLSHAVNNTRHDYNSEKKSLQFLEA